MAAGAGLGEPPVEAGGAGVDQPPAGGGGTGGSEPPLSALAYRAVLDGLGGYQLDPEAESLVRNRLLQMERETQVTDQNRAEVMAALGELKFRIVTHVQSEDFRAESVTGTTTITRDGALQIMQHVCAIPPICYGP